MMHLIPAGRRRGEKGREDEKESKGRSERVSEWKREREREMRKRMREMTEPFFQSAENGDCVLHSGFSDEDRLENASQTTERRKSEKKEWEWMRDFSVPIPILRMDMWPGIF
jgi:hypothetical protein